MMKRYSKQMIMVLCGATVLMAAGCSSMKTPATADVAVSKAAVENATGAGGDEFAPVEMSSARQKLAMAKSAMAEKHYKRASALANEAEADAKLAQGKANSAKAQAAADALNADIQFMREELNRADQ